MSDEEDAIELEELYDVRLSSSKHASTSGTVRHKHIKNASDEIRSVHYDAKLGRVYVGLDSGQILYWQLREDGSGKAKPLGSHAGRITYICTLDRPQLGSRLLVTASADGTIKLWDFQSPAVCTQTLYGHDGLITCIIDVHGCLITGGKDGTIRMWHSDDALRVLDHPVLEQQVSSWVSHAFNPLSLPNTM